ncbi:MAG: hypothetical protein JXB88_09150 [Spirochaetales bacterium]|nr:hypothetical protein [Spirochaetales bacterium]
MLKSKFLFLIFLIITLPGGWCIERITLKESGDRYSGNFVKMSTKNTVFLLFNQRFEFSNEEIEFINFEDSEDELEILLDDNSILKGMIVDQDDEFFTVGSSAGLTTINKIRILEIKNPRFEEFYVAEKQRTMTVHFGIEPAGSLVLNDFGTSYQPYGSLAAYFEMDFGLPVFFGIDIHAFLNIAQFGDTEDFLLVTPIHVYLKYQDILLGMKQLLWSIKCGVGCAPLIFMETGEGNTSFGIAFSQIADLGVKYKLSDNLSLGGNARTNLVVERTSCILTQSIGIVVEFNL